MPDVSRHHVAIVGAGPAGLMAAQVLAEAGCRVTILDRMGAPARKFLLAGRGGLNLTHSEPRDTFLARYGEAAGWLEPIIDAFPPARLRRWALDLGEPTFIGTSGRVFPESFKASPLLRGWLGRLGRLGVTLRPRHHWTGWADGKLSFETVTGSVSIEADATLLALGGASWPRLGSDGDWWAALSSAGVDIAPLRPANCGVEVNWSPYFRDRAAGQPLKRIAISLGGTRVRGEALVTATGLEGGAIYALGAAIRRDCETLGTARILVDVRPDLSQEALANRLAAGRKGESLANRLRKGAGLDPTAITLLREAGPLPTDAGSLAQLIKGVPVDIVGLSPIERAISTAGGVMRASVDEHLMLHALPGVFVAGEMLDWEAPTGGYLLQACFATGHAAARGVLRRLGYDTPEPWNDGFQVTMP